VDLGRLHEKTGNYVRSLLMGLLLIAKMVTLWAWLAECYPARNCEEKLLRRKK
jgi:hypothetical protein